MPITVICLDRCAPTQFTKHASTGANRKKYGGWKEHWGQEWIRRYSQRKRGQQCSYLHTQGLSFGSHKGVSVLCSSLLKAACLGLKYSSHKIYSPSQHQYPPPPLHLLFQPFWQPPFASSRAVCTSAGKVGPYHAKSYNTKSFNVEDQKIAVCLMQDYVEIRDLAVSHHSIPPPPPPLAGSSIRLNALLIFPQELPWAKSQLCSSVA